MNPELIEDVLTTLADKMPGVVFHLEAKTKTTVCIIDVDKDGNITKTVSESELPYDEEGRRVFPETLDDRLPFER